MRTTAAATIAGVPISVPSMPSWCSGSTKYTTVRNTGACHAPSAALENPARRREYVGATGYPAAGVSLVKTGPAAQCISPLPCYTIWSSFCVAIAHGDGRDHVHEAKRN